MRIVRWSLKWWLQTARDRRWICLRRLAARNGFRLCEMCDEIGCSERYLRRVFVDDMGISPGEWLKLERMVEARHRLVEGAELIEVAESLGFASVSSFGRLFKSTYGVPPLRFQRAERRRRRRHGVV